MQRGTFLRSLREQLAERLCCCRLFYGIRSERQLMGNWTTILYRWFVGTVRRTIRSGTPTTFHQEPRAAAENGDVFPKFMTRLSDHSQVKPLLSDRSIFR